MMRDHSIDLSWTYTADGYVATTNAAAPIGYSYDSRAFYGTSLYVHPSGVPWLWGFQRDTLNKGPHWLACVDWPLWAERPAGGEFWWYPNDTAEPAVMTAISGGPSYHIRYHLEFDAPAGPYYSQAADLTMYLDGVQMFRDEACMELAVGSDPAQLWMTFRLAPMCGGSFVFGPPEGPPLTGFGLSSDTGVSGTVSCYRTTYDWPWCTGRVTLSLSLPAAPSAAAPSPVLLACGRHLVSRGSRVWARASQSRGWSSVRETELAAPVLIPTMRRRDEIVCLDTDPVVTCDGGQTWQAAWPAGALPSAVTQWPMSDLGNALLDQAAGLLLGTSTTDGDVLAHVPPHDPATVATLGDVSVAGPCLGRQMGQWTIGALAGGWYREWRADIGTADWSLRCQQDLGDAGLLASACWWVSAAGTQMVVGFHVESQTVRAFWRAGFGLSWDGPCSVADAAQVVNPYVMELAGGTWEVGWLLDDDWHVVRADRPCGEWSPV